MDAAGIKYALNSLLGATGFKALDQYISDRLKGSGMAAFTAPGSYSWTVPPNVTEIWLTACGGGGGGGGGAKTASQSGGGGGGAQCVYRKKYTVTPNSSIAITVGAGGSGGEAGTATSSTNGTAGGNTIVGSLVTLTGGAAGSYAGGAGTTDGTGGPGGSAWTANNGPNGGSGGGGSLGGGGGGGVPYRPATDGSINFLNPGRLGTSGLIGQGGFPATGIVCSNSTNGNMARMTGQGGYSPFGSGKSGVNLPNLNDGPATAGGAGGPGAGGGGGGGGSNTIAAAPGGKGGDGLVIIEY